MRGQRVMIDSDLADLYQDIQKLDRKLTLGMRQLDAPRRRKSRIGFVTGGK